MRALEPSFDCHSKYASFVGGTAENRMYTRWIENIGLASAVVVTPELVPFRKSSAAEQQHARQSARKLVAL
jgi:hypothetical protein